MNDHLRAISDRHGLFLRREALALGYTDTSLARLVRAGELTRVRHGAYTFTREYAAMTPRQRHHLEAMAVLRNARTEVVLSHTTALVELGAPTWELPLDLVHLTRLDRRSGRREAGVRQHRGVLAPSDLARVDGSRLTSPTRTGVDLTRIVGVEHALPVLDHLLHTGATTREELEECARRQALWSHTVHTDLTIRLADGRRESVAESRTAYLMWRHQVPAPRPQHPVCDACGHEFARLDFAWPERGVWLEFDGKEKYLKHRREGESVLDAVLREKRREERIARMTGWRCIRITWAHLCRPAETAAYILSVLAGGPVHA